ncbi:hypothetical protein PMSD_14975 [Paenibacillus macquariensis subsp. defensor]|nr:hypothetical protein PMSD_14975 [Paenibacillus macquariensis subsp. defensor]
MQVGNRIIFDNDGEIVYQTGEMQGDVLQRKEITELNFIDLKYGAINVQTHRIIGVDTMTKQPILEEKPQILTPEQQQVKDLENALLLSADAEVGGIL